MAHLDILLLGSIVLLLAGTIKGFVGLGLPTVAMALLTLKLDPRTAISLILMPLFLSNLWQMLRGDDFYGVVQRYWRFAIVLACSVGLTVFLSQSTSERTLMFCLGVIVLLFVFFSWRDLVPEIPAHADRGVEIALAAIAGVMGGLTAAWAAPLAIYLKAKRVSPDEFVQASGFLISAGSVPLLIMFVFVGHSDLETVGLSAVLLVPTLAGFTLGERLRRGIDPKLFNTVLMVVFLVLGLNLIYRSLTLA